MIEEIRLRKLSPRTEQSYVSAMVGLVKHCHQLSWASGIVSSFVYLLVLKHG